MPTIGGSHAQRDVFERMTIDAGLRAGRYDATEAILQSVKVCVAATSTALRLHVLTNLTRPRHRGAIDRITHHK